MHEAYMYYEIRQCMKPLLLFLAMLYLTVACQNRYPHEVEVSLELAGDKRSEFEEVITHYSQSLEDSSKLKAAYFLIANIPYHHFKDFSNVYSPAFDSVAKHQNTIREYSDELHSIDSISNHIGAISELRRFLFFNFIDSIQQQNITIGERESDIQSINAKFLIDNIDLAFEAHKRLAVDYSLSFQDFCEYVLPYRSTNEPLELDARRRLYSKHNWFYDTLEQTGSLEETIDIFLSSLNFSLLNVYQGKLSVSQMELTRAGRCDDHINYAVNALRALGVPCAFDFTPHWGDHHQNGHSWLYIKTTDGFLTKDPTSLPIVNLNELYSVSSIPKIYRRTFSPGNTMFRHSVDKTSEYRYTQDVEIPCILNSPDLDNDVYVHVFDKIEGWTPVDKAINQNVNQCLFNDLTPGVAYIAGYKDENSFYALNYPFIVEKVGKVRFLNPSSRSIPRATLKRKFPLTLRLTIQLQQKRASSLNGAKLQAANSADFSDSVTLHTIQKFESGLPKKIKLLTTKKYKYYRFIGSSTGTTHLATCNLYDQDDKKIDAIAEATVEFWPSTKRISIESKALESNLTAKVTDDDPLTYIDPAKGLVINYKLNYPQRVHYFLIQPQNDDNYIRLKDTYELLYWNKGWLSLGQQVAKQDSLLYKKVPRNALYWLRNLTRGKEEQVFLISEKGIQVWLGNTDLTLQK